MRGEAAKVSQQTCRLYLSGEGLYSTTQNYSGASAAFNAGRLFTSRRLGSITRPKPGVLPLHQDGMLACLSSAPAMA